MSFARFCQNSGRQCRGDDSRFVIRTDYAAAISAVNARHLARSCGGAKCHPYLGGPVGPGRVATTPEDVKESTVP